MVAEDGVALEDGDGLAAGVGNGDVDGVVLGVADLNRERASGRSGTSEKGDGESLGNHFDLET